MTISSLGFPLGSARSAGRCSVRSACRPSFLAIACAYVALGLVPLFALRNVDPAVTDRRVQITPTAG